MSNIENHFIKPLADFYKTNPFGSGFAKRLEPYAATLSDEVLQSVATRIIERGGKSFPTFAACRDAIARADESMKAPTSTEPRPWEKHKHEKREWEHRLAALKLCRCQMGHTADREGWLVALIEFCEDNGRLPQEREIPSLRAKSKRSDDALERAKGSPFYMSLVGWRKNMLDQAHKDVFGFAEAQDEPTGLGSELSKKLGAA